MMIDVRKKDGPLGVPVTGTYVVFKGYWDASYQVSGTSPAGALSLIQQLKPMITAGGLAKMRLLNSLLLRNSIWMRG